MFERAAALWRRLIHGEPAPAPATPEAERRVWVRHPADLTTQVRADGGPGFSARIRDVSLGGVQLIADHPVEAGELLTVALPSAGAAPDVLVLACVVHCRQVGPGEWAVGCHFACELDEDDLRAFGAGRTRPTPPDNRAWDRYACDVRAVCQVANADDAGWAAQVLNVSASGLALLADRAVPAGALLSAELHGPHDNPPLTILACVVHVTDRGDGRHALGCNFIRELSEADLRSLL
jgi:hypothetical protein